MHVIHQGFHYCSPLLVTNRVLTDKVGRIGILYHSTKTAKRLVGSSEITFPNGLRETVFSAWWTGLDQVKEMSGEGFHSGALPSLKATSMRLGIGFQSVSEREARWSTAERNRSEMRGSTRDKLVELYREDRIR